MTAVRQNERDSALGNFESFRRDAPGMKGDDSDSREQPKNLDIDKHRVSLARGGGGYQHRLRRGAGIYFPC